MYSYKTYKQYTINQGSNHVRCIYEYCHSNKSSVIDSNSRKIIKVNKEKHVGRVWLAPPVIDQYKLFQQSEAMENYTSMDPEFAIPSLSFFYHKRCPCVSWKIMQSCVDFHTSQLQYYIQVIVN